MADGPKPTRISVGFRAPLEEGARPAPRRQVTGEAPPLALFLPIAEYVPAVGDFIVWAGWFNTWYGIVTAVAEDGLTIEVTFEKLPVLLLTQTPDEIDSNKRNRVLPVYRLRGERTGTWAVLKHDQAKNASVWFT